MLTVSHRHLPLLFSWVLILTSTYLPTGIQLLDCCQSWVPFFPSPFLQVSSNLSNTFCYGYPLVHQLIKLNSSSEYSHANKRCCRVTRCTPAFLPPQYIIDLPEVLSGSTYPSRHKHLPVCPPPYPSSMPSISTDTFPVSPRRILPPCGPLTCLRMARYLRSTPIERLHPTLRHLHSNLPSRGSTYQVEEALQQVTTTFSKLAPYLQSVVAQVKLGLDPRRTDQVIRGVLEFPNPVHRRHSRVAVVTGRLDQQEAARAAGAEWVGGQRLIDRIRATCEGLYNDPCTGSSRAGVKLSSANKNDNNNETSSDASGDNVLSDEDNNTELSDDEDIVRHFSELPESFIPPKTSSYHYITGSHNSPLVSSLSSSTNESIVLPNVSHVSDTPTLESPLPSAPSITLSPPSDPPLPDDLSSGPVNFEILICSPDMMSKIGPLGRYLGPKGRLPTPRYGTVTADVASAVRRYKQRNILQYRANKFGVVHVKIGGCEMGAETLLDNFWYLVKTLSEGRPKNQVQLAGSKAGGKGKKKGKGTDSKVGGGGEEDNYFETVFIRGDAGPAFRVHDGQLRGHLGKPAVKSLKG
eukprot:GHVQ01014755.1.p1 GENE.GHVQ01014755.1~~GHVQ01014755.1.p1  ORF type:complete len:580 (+),score=66.92 GHVQ01014755.1:351-2090(+)